jgi:hypothetical protein
MTQTQKYERADTLTHSSIDTFKLCRAKYFWTYELGYRPEATKRPLRIGHAVHHGLDLAAQGMTKEDIGQRIEIMYHGMTKAVNDEVLLLELMYEEITVKCLVWGYIDAWDDSDIEILESEKSYTSPIRNPESGYPARIFQAEGRRDRICRLPDGRVCLMETKTTSEDPSPGTDYRRSLMIATQVSGYYASCIADGYDIEGVIYDVIKKPTIKPHQVIVTDDQGPMIVDENGVRLFKKDGTPYACADAARGRFSVKRDMTAEEWEARLQADIDANPPKYFVRFELSRGEADLADYTAELWDVAQTINEARKLGRWYKSTGACRNWNSLCPYFGLCSGEQSAEPSLTGAPEGFRLATQAHEELL